MIKKIKYFIFLIFITSLTLAQSKDTLKKELGIQDAIQQTDTFQEEIEGVAEDSIVKKDAPFLPSEKTETIATDTNNTLEKIDTAGLTAPNLTSYPKKSTPEPPKEIVFPSFINKNFKNKSAFQAFLLAHNNFYVADGKTLFQPEEIRKKGNTFSKFYTDLFYVFLGVLLLLGILYSAFKKYFHDLFEAFTSPTLSRRQLKEQLSQTPFPSFAFNLFFTISLGLYLFLLFLRKGMLPEGIPVYFAGYFVLFLIFIYALKYMTLRFLGWILKIREIVEGYIFTIFLINKILGVILLPIMVILAFSPPILSNIILDISVLFVVLFLVYRYFRAFPVLNSSTKISKFHFFIYLCAFEIVPVLVLGKMISLWASAI